ncbi:MAG: XrtA system polysaccharide chain length determinant [Aquisalimonadaceae bacterium]
MHDLFNFVLGELRGTWRFRWSALVVAWLVVIAGTFAILTMPDEYRVQARVQVDTESMLQPLLEGLAIAPDLGTRVQMLTNTLLSRDNLERIARESDVSLQARTPLEEEAVLERLRRGIGINSARRSNVYQITYTAGSPGQARQVVQSVIDILMEQTLGMSRADSASATEFLERQVQEHENQLRAAEQRLAEFKRENVGLLPEQGGRDYYQRLRAGEDELERLESELRTAENRRSSLREEVAAMESGQQVRQMDNPRIVAMDEQIRQSKARLDELLLRYTDSHPDVVAQRDQIARQEREREQIGNQPSLTETADLSSNPVYQELQIRLNDVRSEIAALNTQIADQRSRIESLLARVDDITEVETRLADLARTYNVTRERYQTLLGRLSTAEMSTRADETGGQVQFRIIDPPATPLQPSGPPRQLYMVALLAVSLGIGAGFAFFLHQLRPVFQNPRLLAQWTGRPVLGSVSLVMSPTQRGLKFGALAVFGVAVLILVAVAGVGAMYADIGAEHAEVLMRRLPL